MKMVIILQFDWGIQINILLRKCGSVKGRMVDALAQRGEEGRG